MTRWGRKLQELQSSSIQHTANSSRNRFNPRQPSVMDDEMSQDVQEIPAPSPDFVSMSNGFKLRWQTNVKYELCRSGQEGRSSLMYYIGS